MPKVKGLLRGISTLLQGLFTWPTSAQILAYSVLAGVCSGLAAVVFTIGLESLQAFSFGQLMGYISPPERTRDSLAAFQAPQIWWAVLLVPTLGGLACGLIVTLLEPQAEGHGTDAMIRSFHRLNGVIAARVPVVKMLTSILTIGTGGSAGREGPATHIGAGIGSVLAHWLKLGDWDRRMLLVAGAAGGLGAVFRAPLGGAMFAVEVLYSGTAIEFAALGPAFVASVVAYTVFVSILGQGVMFDLPQPDPTTNVLPCAFHGAQELPFYLLLAFLCAGVAYLFSLIFSWGESGFKRLQLPKWMKPAIGGLSIGLIVLLGYPQIMAGGYSWIQKAILASPDIPLRLALALVLLKMLATTLTVASGGSGGLFAPALYVGAMLGCAFGAGCQALFPDLAPPVPACVLVGMGGVLAGTFKVPLTALIMVSELTGSHDLLVPMMLVAAVEMAFLPSRVTLCREQVTTFVESPAHLGDFVIDVLKEMRVGEVCSLTTRPVVIHEHAPLPQILYTVAEAQQDVFPVVDREERLVGVLSLQHLRAVLAGDGAGDLVRAIDLALPVRPVTANDDLHTVLQIMAEKQLDAVPVVANEDHQKVIGMIRRDTVLTAYDRRVLELQTGTVGNQEQA